MKQTLKDMGNRLTTIEKEMVERDSNLVFKMMDEVEDRMSQQLLSIKEFINRCPGIIKIQNLEDRIHKLEQQDEVNKKRIWSTMIGIFIAAVGSYFSDAIRNFVENILNFFR